MTLLIKTPSTQVQVEDTQMVQLEHDGKIVTVPANYLFELAWTNSDVSYGKYYWYGQVGG